MDYPESEDFLEGIEVPIAMKKRELFYDDRGTESQTADIPASISLELGRRDSSSRKRCDRMLLLHNKREPSLRKFSSGQPA